MSGDGGYQGLGQEGGEVGPVLDEGGAVGGREGQRRHFFDVGTGGEGTLGAGQDYGADGGGGLEGAEGGVEFIDERGAERVKGFGAVDCYFAR